MELKEKDCLSKEDFAKYKQVKSFFDKINKAVASGELLFDNKNTVVIGTFDFDLTGHIGFGITSGAGYVHLYGETKAKKIKEKTVDLFTIVQTPDDIDKYFSTFKTLDPKSFKTL